MEKLELSLHRLIGLMLMSAAMVGLIACTWEPPDGKMSTAKRSAALFNAGKTGTLLKVLLEKAPTVQNVHRAMPKDLVAVKVGKVAGTPLVLVDVLIKGDKAALPKLKALGVDIRTVTKNGIMTATVPLNKVKAIAALTEVTRIEAGKRIKMYNDDSNGGVCLETAPDGSCVNFNGMNNPRTSNGAGVVVGVIDTGLDWTHGDFINDTTGATRIKYYWDQSDTADLNPPSGFTYGHEYTEDNINACIDGDYATTCDIRTSAEDSNGHGTHVTGTAAGDGSASGLMGVAPAATIVFVKFDFDGDRNSDTAIIDGVNYIFQKAAALNMPAAINMSLGTDFGPHDGSTLEERGIDDLTGPGKIVVVAAGNPGENNWGKLGWGYAMHGQAQLGQEFTYTISPYDQYADQGLDGLEEFDYLFLDLWYPSTAPDGKTNDCRVMITTPGETTYPTSTSGANRKTWTTGSRMTGYSTSEGALIVGNGGDQFDWGTNNGDHEVYVEISDYWGINAVAGTWSIKLVPSQSDSTCSGEFHVWYGASASIILGWRDVDPNNRQPPTFNGAESDNRVTIGSPASADTVLAVAAYLSRNCWSYAEYWYNPEDPEDTANASCQEDQLSPAPTQCYGSEPITYYDPFATGELAYFSGRGPRRDGVLKPEIATPGVGIASSLSHTVLDRQLPNKCDTVYDYEENYHFFYHRALPNLKATVIQGTSMACPNATGAVALILKEAPTMDIGGLRTLLAGTARHDAVTDTYANNVDSAQTDTDDCMVTESCVNNGNNDWGYGKMDLTAALGTFSCSNDADCDDGAFCNGAETCVNGACQAGSPPSCDDGVPCTDDSCNETSDSCDNTDSCAGDQCNGGTCDLSSGSCVLAPTNEGGSCDDGDACTAGETCQSGSCGGGSGVTCDDSDDCTTDTCDPSTGCVYTPIAGCGTTDPCIDNPGAPGCPCTESSQCDSNKCLGRPGKKTCK